MADEQEIEINEQLTSINVTKYQTAADVANRALKTVIDAAVDGANVLELCKLGDSTIIDACKGVFTKEKKMVKGLAFPTCVSPNDIICHLSPLAGEKEASLVLKNGDMVRIELGAQIDGFAAQVAHTVIVGAKAPITGRQADVLQAAHLAGEAVVRLMRPGNSNLQVAEAIEKIAKDFECVPVEGMMSNQISQNSLEGEKQIIVNPAEHQKKDVVECKFEEGEAYTIDILLSTGDGKAKPHDAKVTVYKRNQQISYQLKMKTSRLCLSEIDSKFGSMGFSLSNFDDPKKAKLGITECVAHQLVTPYHVLHEKEDSFVAHYMFTVLLMPQGPLKITNPPFVAELVSSEKSVQDEALKELLKTSVRPKNKKKKSAK